MAASRDDFGLFVMQDHAQQRAVNLHVAVIIDEAKLTKFAHEIADTRSGGADHLGQSLLADRRYDPLGLPLLAEIRKDEKQARQAFFARIKKLIDKVRFDANVAGQQVP